VPLAEAQVSDRLYWSQEDFTHSGGTSRIGRVDLDGSNSTPILTVADLPIGAMGNALDSTNLKMYWTERWGKIKRSNFDGTNLEELVTGQTVPWNLALDVGNAKMYWTEYSGHTVKRANLDGSSIETLYSGTGAMAGIALDLVHGKIYAADAGNSQILRMNLDGSSQEIVISTGLNFPLGLALDVNRDRLFVADFNADSIFRASSNGVGLTAITNTTQYVTTLAVDPTNGRVYWASYTGNVGSVNADGGEGASVVSGLNAYLRQISLDVDRDGDGTHNSLDGCPLDSGKITAGYCGCGIADTDANSNGASDCLPEDGLIQQLKVLKKNIQRAKNFSSKRVKKSQIALGQLIDSYPVQGTTFAKAALQLRYQAIAKNVRRLLRAVRKHTNTKSTKRKLKRGIERLSKDLMPQS